MPSASSSTPACGAHRAEVAQRHAARAGAAPTRAAAFASRACTGHAPGPAARAPSTRSARARGDRVGDPRQLARVERRVAVHEADDVGARRGQPGPAGGAEPAPRLDDHLRAEPGGQRARAVGASRCRRRSARSRPASARAPTGARRARPGPGSTTSGMTPSYAAEATSGLHGALPLGCATHVRDHPRHRRRRLHRLARGRPLLARGHDVRAVDALLPAAHRERPGYLDPAAEWIEGDLRDPAVAARAVHGVAPSRTRRRWSGSASTSATCPTTSATTTSPPRSSCARSPRRGFDRPARARLQHGRLRRGPLRVRRARRRRTRAARGRGPRRRPLRAALPALRPPARLPHRARGRAARPAQRLRRDQARAGAPVRRVRQRDGRPRDRAALPQRLRPADAARHAVRRRREHLPLRLRRRPRAARVRGRRSAARLRARARRRAARTSARSRRATR